MPDHINQVFADHVNPQIDLFIMIARDYAGAIVCVLLFFAVIYLVLLAAGFIYDLYNRRKHKREQHRERMRKIVLAARRNHRE